jgi:serine/threonine protein kinase
MIGKTPVHYEISAQIGRGGMGEVYQAKDTKLGRDVAIKVLPEEFALDTDRVARFQREAKLLASLNHPNIAAVYGLEESDGTHFLVMELIEGNTLRDRIKSGPIPVEEALKLALQMAEALEAAHENGVIHRDLKPANIKVTPDGKVKILDFGLAKAYAGDQGNVSLADSPTISAAATRQGVILGTAAYMSPEQAKGKTVDKRADIWAFGVVLFEMLTGKSLFSGEDVSSTLARVLEREPDFSTLPQKLHPRIQLMLERCLKKDPKDRYSGISDARVDIQGVLVDPSGVFVQPSLITKPKKKLQVGIPLVAAMAILCLIVAGVAVWYLKPPEPRKVMRFDYDLPEDQQFSHPNHQLLAVSPDGTQFVYCTTEGLYLRAENELDAKFIRGTNEIPTFPFFSPDGQWIGYYSSASKKLMKIAINGGAPEPLCDLSDISDFFGASWGEDDMIIYVQNPGPVMRISANGGNPEPLIEAEGILYNPQILPDGKTVMFSQYLNNSAQVAMWSAETGDLKVLFPGHTARYLPTGHIVYAMENSLFAIPFDLDSLKILGQGAPVVEGVSLNLNGFGMYYAVSKSGTLAYMPGLARRNTEATLVWVDRDGKEEPLGSPAGPALFPRISPDGKLVALGSSGENADIWIWDLARKTMMRLTREEGNDITPLWTRDGQRILYTSLGEKRGIYCKNADGTGKNEFLISTPDRTLWPYSWSDDGKTLVMGETIDGGTLFDISILSMEGDHARKPLIEEEFMEMQPQVSPDGEWIAYTSNESGQNEIFVRPFPGVDTSKYQVSTNGGSAPLWSPDGKELFYLRPDDGAMAVVAVKVETEPTFKPGLPETLFQGPYYQFPGCPWDIHPIDKRFLMAKPSTAGGSEAAVATRPKIIIIRNWFEELKERVPVD